MMYLVLILGIIIGIAVKSWHESWSTPKENEHVVIRKFEYSSYQLVAYNSVREAIEQNADKFKLLTLKFTGSVVFDNLGIFLKYKSLHGHILKFNYDMSHFDIIDPPKANEL